MKDESQQFEGPTAYLRCGVCGAGIGSNHNGIFCPQCNPELLKPPPSMDRSVSQPGIDTMDTVTADEWNGVKPQPSQPGEAKEENYIPGDSGFVIKKLNEIIKRKDLRIGELEAERDAFAVKVIQWITLEVSNGRLRNHTNGDFRQDSTGKHFTYSQIVQEYKKQQL